MPDITTLWSASPFNVRKAALLAKGCALSYDQETDADRSAFAVAVDAKGAVHQAQSGFHPAYTVYRLAFGNKIICFSGTTRLAQALEYWRNSDALEMVKAGSPPTIAYVNRFSKALYDQMASGIKSALGVTGNSPPAQLFTVAGHSLGGAIAQHLTADLIGNHSASAAVQDLYTFGSPRVGDPRWGGFLPLNNTFSVCNHRDPIPYWPQDHVHQFLRNSLDMVFTTRPYQVSVPYGCVGNCIIVDRGGVRQYADFPNMSLEQTARLMFGLLQNGSLPPDHRISEYYRHLYDIARTTVQPGTGASVAVTEALTLSDQIPIEGGVTQDALPAPSLPTMRDPIVISPPAIAGNTITRSQSTVVGAVVPQMLVFDTPIKTRRARNGDGRIKKFIKKMRQIMDYCDYHDAAVAGGRREGTQYLHDPGQWTPELQAAWELLYLRLCAKENGTMGS